MKKISLLLGVILALQPLQGFCQLERIVVETYYVCDELDATDTTGGPIAEGLVTYRVYADLLPNTEILSIYGDNDHPFIVESTLPFFNHSSDGQTLAKEFLKARYQENTVALDTWLTIGQTTKKQGAITHYGIPKNNDVDGSFIGGINNDGGSEMIASGLLNNQDLEFPLTIADGMDTLDYTPEDWLSFGITDFLSGLDSTIFGSVVNDVTAFNSENFVLSCSGVRGVDADSNYILLAQLTTLGELSLRLNMRVRYLVDGVPTEVSYVGTNVINAEDEVYSPILSYPLECGCTDPNFLEYDVTFSCPDASLCQTPIAYGCMDTLACNYDALANFSIPALCCYPGFCANRNIEAVCPSLLGSTADLTIYPNPVSNTLNVNVLCGVPTTSQITIRNSQGITVLQEHVLSTSQNYNTQFDVESLDPGIYQIQVITEVGPLHQLFVVL
jgi:hypothetical protein